jgi:hypothetical protein
MDRDERIQFMAAIIASGLCAQPQYHPDDDPLNHLLASRAVEIALRIAAAAPRFAQEYGGHYMPPPPPFRREESE